MEDSCSAWLQEAMQVPVSASLGPMGSLLRKLHTLNASKECLSAGVNEGEIQNFKSDLEGLCVSLMNLSEAKDTSFTAKYWMKEAREVCYDAENYLDKVMNPSNICWIHKLLKRRAQIAHDFSSLVARMADARGRYVRFLQIDDKGFRHESGQANINPEMRLAAGVTTPELSLKLSVLVPHMDDLVKLLAFDDQTQKQLKVVSIFGYAGVGKTTVGRTVYRMFGGKFDCRAFLRASRQPDIRRLLSSMLTQIKAPPALGADVYMLAANIRKHLKYRRHLIIIDELWTTSVWDTIKHAFPDGNCGSRVITITQIEDVALATCTYQSKYIFKMRSPSDFKSRELSSSGVFNSEGGSFQDFNEVSYGVISTLSGFPLATANIGSIREPNLVRQQWEEIRDSLSSTLSRNPTSKVMEEVLNLIYHSLPPYLKTCLLYLTMYPEDYTIRKDVLVNQWIAEGFIGVVKQQDMEEDEVKEQVRVAQGYFAELVSRGMIQPVDINDKGEVLSCTIHHMVLDLIRCKSMEDNFITMVDKFPPTSVLPDKVRRLSVQFGSAKGARISKNMVLSQVRSLVFFGFFECVPSTMAYEFLRVLNLHIWADQNKIFDLTTMSELLQLRYFKIECNITIKLPAKIRMLQFLETLEVDAGLSVAPSDIVDLKSLLHLCLPSQVNLPGGIVQMTSLRSLGYFNLSTNSKSNVLGLGKLIKLWDLQLICSTVPSDHLVENMGHLCSVLGDLSELKSLILDAGTSSVSISCDSLSCVSSAPALLERLEFPQICMFSSLPKWFGNLKKLCILKIAIMEPSTEDIDILKGMNSLTAFSMRVSIAPTAIVFFGQDGFEALKYFKFTCTVPRLVFAKGAMPRVQRLKLRFNANNFEQCDLVHAHLDHLSGLQEISAKIGTIADGKSDSKAALLMDIFGKLPSRPIFNVQSVGRILNDFKEKSSVEKEERHKTTETQDAGVEVSSSGHQYAIQDFAECTSRQAGSGTSVGAETYLHVETLGEVEDTVAYTESALGALEAASGKHLEEHFAPEQGLEERGIQEKGPREDNNKQADSRSSMPTASISHLQDPDQGEDVSIKTLKKKHRTLKRQHEIVEDDSKHGVQEKISVEGTRGQAKIGTFVPSESSFYPKSPELNKICIEEESVKKVESKPVLTPEEIMVTSACATPGRLSKGRETEIESTWYMRSANLAVDLAKALLQRVVTKVHLVEKEAKLWQTAQCYLAFITGEFEMMHSCLSVADDERVKNKVVMTWVKQICELAYAVEDCIETVDTKPSCRRHLVPSCIYMTAVTPSLDEVVTEIGYLKDMVQDVSRQNTFYKLVSDCGSKPAVMQQLPGVASATAFNMLMEGRDTKTRQKGLQGDLTQWITRNDGDLQVISLWGTGGDFGKTSIISKSYKSRIYQDFTCRAWVRLAHPFNLYEFVQGLLAQFYANFFIEQPKALIGLEVLHKMNATLGDLLKEFQQLVRNERYLIVLEDLSNVADWDAIRTFLPNKKNGSWIIVSTQQLEIASLCVGHSYQAFELRKFSADHSVYAFFREGPRGDRDIDETNKVSADHSEISIEDKVNNYKMFHVSKKNAANEWIKKHPLIGRESEMNELRRYTTMARLNDVQIMFVEGICGVGKSALIRNLFCEIILKKGSFGKHGWVDVSHPFNLRDFCQSLLLDFYSDSLQNKKLDHGTIGSKHPIQECREVLEQHCCLVVIDHLQTVEEWNCIKAALVSDPLVCRSVIIVIPTEASVAAHCVGNKELTFYVKGLEADEAFAFFKKEVHKKEPLSPLMDLEAVSLRELITKCGGLPKVIIAIAESLVSKEDTLMETIVSTNNRFMETLETNPEYDRLWVLFTWMHSYLHTCLDSLKPCIFYMPIFPRNHSIRRRRLVRRWVAEGYSMDNEDKSAEQNGEMFFSKLVEMNIIQQPSQSATTTTLGDTRMVVCEVNGFFHQYILSHRVEDNLIVELGGSCTPTDRRTPRHLIARESWDRDKIVFKSINFSRLRSLTVFGDWKSFLISKKMTLLQVLDLEDASGVNDDDLDKMAKHLNRLKFLSLRGCREIHHLPSSLGNLGQLQSLDVRYTSIVTLPANITKLRKLQYIRAGTNDPAEEPSIPCCSVSRLSGCCRQRHHVGVEVPKGVGKLTALHTIGVVNVAASGAKTVMNEIKKLTQLRKLGVSGIDRNNIKKIFSAISGHRHLESLSVSLHKDNQWCCFKRKNEGCFYGVPLSLDNLRSLKLYGLRGNLPEWGEKLGGLTKMDLETTMLTQDDIRLLGCLPKLLTLRICVNPPLDGELCFHVYMNGLELRSYNQVKVLEIASRRSLHVTFGSEAMQNLELLKINCFSESAYQFSGLGGVSGLKKVLLRGTNHETLMTDLQRQLVNHPRQPVVSLDIPR